MKLSIQGGTVKQQNMIEDIVMWSLPKLITNRHKEQLELTFSIQKLIKIEHQNSNGTMVSKKDPNLAGICIWIDRGVKPRELEISISTQINMTDKLFTSTSIHELIHLSQYMKGELKHKITDNKFYWKNVLVDTDTTNYWDLPWENEAIFNEVLMCNEYQKDKSRGYSQSIYSELNF